MLYVVLFYIIESLFPLVYKKKKSLHIVAVQNLLKEFEDSKGVIRIRKSKNSQHNGQMEKDKRTNSYLQSTTHKTKDQSPLKTEVNSGTPEWVSISCSTSPTRCVALVANWVISHE